MSNNQSPLIQLVQALVSCFCSSNQNQQQQQQGQGYPQQQQYNNQNAYPPQNGMQYPQQPQQAWNGQNGPLHQQSQSQQNQQWQSPHKPTGLGASAGHLGSSPIGPHHAQNSDQVNATNTQYTSLRDQARKEADLAHKCFADSQAAYQSGDGARAHDLSAEGKKHMARKEELDSQASGWIYQANNSDSPPNTVDLHGLYVKEAIAKTSAAIEAAQRSGAPQLRVIVGKGNHSVDHVAKIKPAIEEMMQKYNLSAHIDPQNTGVLIVDLAGKQGSRDVGGLMRDINGKENECVIM